MLRKTRIFGAAMFIGATYTSYAGFYAGSGIGPDTVDFNQRAHAIMPANDGIHPPSFDVINKAHLSATGVFGTIFGGYEKIHNRFYLAGEVNANISSVEFSGFNHEFIHQNFADTFIKIKNSYGISVLPGFQFTPDTLLYGRLGWTNSKIEQQTSDLSLAGFSVRRAGFRYGVGVKQAITQRVALRMDYSRIDYDDIVTGTNDGIVPKTTELSPNQQLLEFGVVVNFDQPSPTK